MSVGRQIRRFLLICGLLTAPVWAALDDKQVIVMLNAGYKSADVEALIQKNGYVGRRDADTLLSLKVNGASQELLDLLSYDLKFPFPLVLADVRAMLLNKSPIGSILQEIQNKGFQGTLSTSQALDLVTYGATPELIKKIQRTSESNLRIPDEVFLLIGRQPHLAGQTVVFEKAGYGTETSRMLIRPEWEEAGAFSSGLARVRSANKYGYIDKNGSWAIEPRFPSARDFSEGRAVVTMESADEEEIDRYITTEGKLLTNDFWQNAGDFKEGLAHVTVNGKVGFIDLDGKMVIPPKWSGTGDFHQGLAWVKSTQDSGQSAYGFIDRKGVLVIPLQWDEVRDFSEGLAAVKKGALWGYINPGGKSVIEPKYQEAHPFSESVAAVKVDYFSLEKWIYINLSGELAITGTWLEAGDFHKGVAQVGDSNGRLIMNRDGNRLLPGEWRLAQNQPQGNVILITRQPPGKSLEVAYIDLTGRIIWRGE